MRAEVVETIGELRKGWLRRERPSNSAFGAAADYFAIGLATALPWSTSAAGILICLWILAILPRLRVTRPSESLTAPAALPVLLWLFAALGMMWAEVPWLDRLSGLEAFFKLLLIPLALTQFRRSDKALQVLAAFLISCTILLAVSYVLALWPGVTWRGARNPGVPVKEYVAQSTE